MNPTRTVVTLAAALVLVTACGGGSGAVPGGGTEPRGSSAGTTPASTASSSTVSSSTVSSTAPSSTGSPDGSAAPSPDPATTPGRVAPESPSPPGGGGAPSAGAPILDAPWATVELTDVTDGSTFRIADLAGRPIFVETMAIWCSTCLAQQQTAAAALPDLPADTAFLVLDVESAESAADLRAYREEHGFPFRYAIAPPELSRALAAEFGDFVLNPPSAPIVFISRDGTATAMPMGEKSRQALIEQAGG